MSLRRGPIDVKPLSLPGCLWKRSQSDVVDTQLLDGPCEGSEVLVVETEGIASLLDDLQSG